MEKAYLKLKLTEQQIVEMQNWLYPKMADPNIKSMAQIIDEIVDRYKGDMRHYTLYHLGYITGVAREREEIGLPLLLNPDII